MCADAVQVPPKKRQANCTDGVRRNAATAVATGFEPWRAKDAILRFPEEIPPL